MNSYVYLQIRFLQKPDELSLISTLFKSLTQLEEKSFLSLIFHTISFSKFGHIYTLHQNYFHHSDFDKIFFGFFEIH